MVIKYIITQALKAGVKKVGVKEVGRKTLTIDESAARIAEINKKLKRTPKKAHIPGFTEKAGVRQDVAEDYAQEVADIYAGKWKGKK